MKKTWHAIKDIFSVGSVMTFVASPMIMGEISGAISKDLSLSPENTAILWFVLWVSFALFFMVMCAKPWKDKRKK